MVGLYLYTLILCLQIFRYVKYTKEINIAKVITKFCDKICVFETEVKTQQQQNKQSNINTPAGAGK